MRAISWAALGMGASLLAAPAAAQTFPGTPDPVLQRIWTEGTERSQVERLLQVLSDSLGPRLTGSPGMLAANDWVVSTYGSWGIPARKEQYGTWRGWRRGITHVDLLEPRVRTLEGQMLAWSPGTNGPVTGPAIALPEVAGAAEFAAWLPSVRGKFVLTSMPQPTCRPDDNWEKWALPESLERMKRERAAAAQAWQRRIANTGVSARDLPRRLEQAGALGVVTSLWSQGWGVQKVFNGRTETVPSIDLSCEDYGLVFRLAKNGQGPVLRLDAQSQNLGEVPVFNTIGEIRGRQRPNEYVVLSAHFDSWDGSSGSTDNGTGTTVMMEAMRILKAVYPNPRRTILVGHWSGEEQGLNGSRAFVKDHPQIVSGVQVVLNQDNGTGRVTNIGMQGFTRVLPYFQRWLGAIPTDISKHIRTDGPGLPSGGGSDHAAFVCAGAPGFMLSSLSWDYGTYTWHTNRDTYDKVSFDDVRSNALLVAMLAYLASEEPQRIPRDRLTALPNNPQTGQPRAWPTCTDAARNTGQSTR